MFSEEPPQRGIKEMKKPPNREEEERSSTTLHVNQTPTKQKSTNRYSRSSQNYSRVVPSTSLWA